MVVILDTIKAAIANTGKLLEVRDLSKNADAMFVISDLKLTLADIKVQVADLIEENADLRSKLEKANQPPEVELRNGIYYKPGEDNPYCSACYENNGQLIPLVELSGHFQVIAKYSCPSCKAHYN